MKNPFEKHDHELAQDMEYLEAIGDRVPTDEDMLEFTKIFNRTMDRLIQLSYIDDGTRSRN